MKFDAGTIVEETVTGLLKLGFVTSVDDVISRCHWRQEYGTPLSFVGRTQAMREMQIQLAAAHIHSIGRLGAWNYELSGVSDSFMQGVRCVDQLLQEEDAMLNTARGHVPKLAPLGAQWQADRPVYTVLVDMDNTLCNYEEAFERAVREQFPHIDIVPQERRLHWHIELDYPEEHRALVVSVNSIPGFFRNMKPNEYGCETLHEMLAEGLEVFIVTAPDPVTTAQCVAEKVRWVEEHLGSEWKNRLILTRDKTTIAGDVLIDDKPTCHTGRAKPSWKHVVFHQSYNADLPNRRRIRHWRDWRRVLFPRVSRQLPATLFPDGAIRFSFVVTTHDAELNQLRKTLDAIIAQTATLQVPVEHEVLVIDDHTCGMHPIYPEYREKCDLRFINEIPTGASSSINTGVEAAKHSYIVVVDWCSDFAEHSSLGPKLARFLAMSNHCIPHVFATKHGVLGFPKPAWQSLPEGRARVAVSEIVELLVQDGCTRVPMEELLSDGMGVERLSS
jgi:5'-nucleotidase